MPITSSLPALLQRIGPLAEQPFLSNRPGIIPAYPRVVDFSSLSALRIQTSQSHPPMEPGGTPFF